MTLMSYIEIRQVGDGKVEYTMKGCREICDVYDFKTRKLMPVLHMDPLTGRWRNPFGGKAEREASRRKMDEWYKNTFGHYPGEDL